ncbi:MAG: HAD family phosphatase [Proteobacteria bacterium]|nr:HAD family phosphatase [Pseudomonadota bacterium]MBU1709017.1 HAD family phosphatase [Pseudomonadota bacterium]
MIKAVLLDFGGVIAEEGFAQGLREIARSQGKNPEEFFRTAAEIVYDCGYVVGAATTAEYWKALRQATGIIGSDDELSREILDRFIVRPQMIDIVRILKSKSIDVAILSDQSNWLDILDYQQHFFKEFDAVYNSYHLGKSKKDPSIFTDTIKHLGIHPHEALFVDDNQGHIDRARKQGLQTILFESVEGFGKELQNIKFIV